MSSFDNSPLMTGNPDKDRKIATALTLQGEFGGVEDAKLRREYMQMAAEAAVNTFGKGDWASNYGDWNAHLDSRFYAPRDGVSGKNIVAQHAMQGQPQGKVEEDSAKDAMQMAYLVSTGKIQPKYNAQFYYTPEEVRGLKAEKKFDFSQVDKVGKLGKYELYSYKPDIWKKKVEASDEAIALQTRLQELGLYDGKIDGHIGPRSKEAIKSLQRAAGLKPDGIVGKKTKDVLAKLSQ